VSYDNALITYIQEDDELIDISGVMEVHVGDLGILIVEILRQRSERACYGLSLRGSMWVGLGGSTWIRLGG